MLLRADLLPTVPSRPSSPQARHRRDASVNLLAILKLRQLSRSPLIIWTFFDPLEDLVKAVEKVIEACVNPTFGLGDLARPLDTEG